MASSVIHICIANEINKTLNRKKKDILIGSIAPDQSKLIGESKVRSHFLDDKYDDTPNIEIFLDKYRNNLDDDFVLGYYIHLYTDYLWFKYFIPEFYNGNYIYKLDGDKVLISGKDMIKYLYNDYTNLNIRLIDEYNLDLDIFYEELPSFNNIISEIDMNRLDIIVDKTGVIIENSKLDKLYIFDMDIINKFIKMSVSSILSNLEELGVIN